MKYASRTHEGTLVANATEPTRSPGGEEKACFTLNGTLFSNQILGWLLALRGAEISDGLRSTSSSFSRINIQALIISLTAVQV